MQKKEILIISDGKIGHYNQSLGVLKALEKTYGVNHTTVNIKIKNSFVKRILKILLNLEFAKTFFERRENLKYIKVFYDGFEIQKVPDIIISSGKNTTFLNAWLSLAYSAKNIFSGNPRGVNSELFSAILTVIDLGLKNQITIDVAPSIIDNQTLKKKGEEFLKWINLNRDVKYFSLLIGGDSRGYKYQKDDILDLIENIKFIGEEYGIKWLITTSRRTTPLFEKLLSENLKDEYLIIYNETQNSVILPFLALSERVFVTEDSASMISEAVSANKEVYSLYPKETKMDESYKKILDKFANARLLKRIYIRDKFEIEENYFNISEVEILDKLSKTLKDVI